MTSEEYVSNLLKVSELKKEIKNKFTKTNFAKSGFETGFNIDVSTSN